MEMQELIVIKKAPAFSAAAKPASNFASVFGLNSDT